MIVDDVITAGTAIRESMEIKIKQHDDDAVRVLLSLDNKKKGVVSLSAIRRIRARGLSMPSLFNYYFG